MIDPLFLKIQAIALAIAIIPFAIGMWYYRRDRRIDKTGGRAAGTITKVYSQPKIPEMKQGPIVREGRDALHQYIVHYVCRHGYNRTLDVFESGLKSYKEDESIEVAYLLENAAIAQLTSDLYTSAYFSFSIAGLIFTAPLLLTLFFRAFFGA
jgi:hypothetical protein